MGIYEEEGEAEVYQSATLQELLCKYRMCLIRDIYDRNELKILLPILAFPGQASSWH